MSFDKIPACLQNRIYLMSIQNHHKDQLNNALSQLKESVVFVVQSARKQYEDKMILVFDDLDFHFILRTVKYVWETEPDIRRYCFAMFTENGPDEIEYIEFINTLHQYNLDQDMFDDAWSACSNMEHDFVINELGRQFNRKSFIRKEGGYDENGEYVLNTISTLNLN